MELADKLHCTHVRWYFYKLVREINSSTAAKVETSFCGECARAPRVFSRDRDRNASIPWLQCWWAKRSWVFREGSKYEAENSFRPVKCVPIFDSLFVVLLLPKFFAFFCLWVILALYAMMNFSGGKKHIRCNKTIFNEDLNSLFLHSSSCFPLISFPDILYYTRWNNFWLFFVASL